MLINLPEKQPEMTIVDRQAAKETWGAKFMPRDAAGAERFLKLKRPQASPSLPGGPDRGFVSYVRGDLLRATRDWVVVAAGKPFRGDDSFGPRWLQYVVARLATEADLAAVADQIEADKIHTHAVMDRMMSS